MFLTWASASASSILDCGMLITTQSAPLRPASRRAEMLCKLQVLYLTENLLPRKRSVKRGLRLLGTGSLWTKDEITEKRGDV